MVGKAALKSALAEFKQKLQKDFPVQKIILFGSQAEGTAGKHSDVDLIIVSGGFGRLNFIERAAKMYDYWGRDYPVDFLCYTPKEFRERKNGITLVRQALKYGVAV